MLNLFLKKSKRFWLKSLASIEIPPAADIYFVPHNAYHTREMHCIAEECIKRGLSVHFFEPSKYYNKHEGAPAELKRLAIKHSSASPFAFGRMKGKFVFLMNDWSNIANDAIAAAKANNLKCISLVEGTQDYEDTHVKHIGVGKLRYPYQHSDLVLVPGEYATKYFTKIPHYVTGIPRIEKLRESASPIKIRKRVLINANFSYGLYTKIQKAWVQDCIDCCKELGLDPIISRHIANPEKFENLPVSKRSLYDELQDCEILISRFSSVIYEAMALKRKVIYYNPHGEIVDTFQDPKSAFPNPIKKEDLLAALKQLSENDLQLESKAYEDFFQFHINLNSNQSSASRIVDCIQLQLKS